jgi:hypothetical protein
MSDMIDRVAKAIYRCFEDRPDYAQLQMNGVLAEELAKAAVEAMREPTEAMQFAGFRVNKFENKHGDKWGCPGVDSGGPFPRDAFTKDGDECTEPERVKAWIERPHCHVARVTIPADKAWTAMIDAALAATPQGRE